MKFPKTLFSILVVVIVFVFLQNLNPVWWQNMKLKTTPIWGLFTISNNPLLPGLDKDLVTLSDGVTRVSPERLFAGGPPKDGIPSIDNPQFSPIEQSEFGDDELIIGLKIGDDIRAYPYSILNWHEIVNDVVGGIPVAVTYCPLCETNSVFVRELDINGEKIVPEFGVSGKLYESCLVMFDRTTDSLYSQPWGLGITGSEVGRGLELVPAVRTTIGAWKGLHPESTIMTTDTGYERNYQAYPYGSYYTDETLLFDVSRQDQNLLGVKEISHIIFDHSGPATLDRFSGEEVFFSARQVREAGEIPFVFKQRSGFAKWDVKLATVAFVYDDGEVVPSMAMFGFVYPAHFR